MQFCSIAAIFFTNSTNHRFTSLPFKTKQNTGEHWVQGSLKFTWRSYRYWSLSYGHWSLTWSLYRHRSRDHVCWLHHLRSSVDVHSRLKVNSNQTLARHHKDKFNTSVYLNEANGKLFRGWRSYYRLWLWLRHTSLCRWCIDRRRSPSWPTGNQRLDWRLTVEHFLHE